MEHKKAFDEHYFLLRLLGRSMYSEVWLAHDEFTNMDVALKIYSPSSGLNDEGLNIFAKEFAMIAKNNHENLMSPIHYGQFNRQPYLVLPYCSQGCIAKRTGLLKETEIWKYIYDVARGLEALHEKNPPMIHQNLKPNNILISDSGNYMLADFYLSQRCKDVLRKVTARVLPSASSTTYMAPETFEQSMSVMASDIYSLGVTTFELITGSVPFGKSRDWRQNNTDIPKLPDKLSSKLNKVIRQCLSKNPWERPSASDLVKIAEKKMKGEGGDHPQKKGKTNKLILFALSCMLVLGIVAGWTVFHTQQRKNEEIAMESVKTDSIRKLILQHVSEANKLYKIGVKKEEFYDYMLIQAYQEYEKALVIINENDSTKFLKLKDSVKRGLAIVDRRLQTAYNEMKDKAEYFKDEPAVKIEFENRANNIAKTLNKER